MRVCACVRVCVRLSVYASVYARIFLCTCTRISVYVCSTDVSCIILCVHKSICLCTCHYTYLYICVVCVDISRLKSFLCESVCTSCVRTSVTLVRVRVYVSVHVYVYLECVVTVIHGQIHSLTHTQNSYSHTLLFVVVNE